MVRYVRLSRAIPRDVGDRIVMALFIMLIFTISLFESICILPVVYENTVDLIMHSVFGSFIFFNIMCSFIHVILVDTTTSHMLLPAILKPKWVYCSSCETNSPPRCDHCWFCNRCILRREYHCVFTGNCIGLNNLRHFMTLAFYLLVGMAYCHYLNLDYILELFNKFDVYAFISMIAPFVSWLFGLTKGISFLLCFVSAVCMFGLVGISIFGSYQCVNIYKGQTVSEKQRGISDYNNGISHNIKEVFGSNWKIAWICSLIPSSLPSDGLSYKERLKQEVIKSM